jgi:aspartyl-tRNA synthetase
MPVSFPRSNESVQSLTASCKNFVILTGWVDKKPKKMSKGLAFVRLRDQHGDTIQLVDRNEPSLVKSLKPESSVVVSGVVESNQGSQSLDVAVSSVQILNQASIIGSHLTAGTKEWPAEYRYIQLRQREFQNTLRRRAKIMSICRLVLDKQRFIEIETPLLFKSTPEGAREFLVPTRKMGYMYALPQSPQQYKQLLMASGVDRYYQIAKCFRDEDLRADRQPEFTQLDLEMSFANGSDVRLVIEDVVKTVWESITNQKLYTMDDGKLLEAEHFSYLTYSDAIAKYGIDKPDLRSTLEIIDLSDVANATENLEYPVLEAIVLKGAADGLLAPLMDPNNYRNRAPIVQVIKSQEDIHRLSGLLNEVANIPDPESFYAKLGLQQGDVVAFSTRQKTSYENPTPLGRFRQLAIQQFPNEYRRIKNDGSLVSPSDFVATWVVDFPLFNPSEVEAAEKQCYPIYDYRALIATHHPFTMVNLDDYDILETHPLQVRGQHYDLVINGVEVGGGSTRIHDVTLQKYIFEHILKISNSQALFGHLLEAFSTGCPPHAGLAIGFDRMTAMLSGTSSIRDVIAFPKTVTGADPVIGSPSKVTSSQLTPYYVKTI